MKSSLPVRKNLLTSGLAIAMTFLAASASAARASSQRNVTEELDACRSIPKYPNLLPGRYNREPIKPAEMVPENLVSQESYDRFRTILAFYKKALPGWILIEPPIGSWPTTWIFFKNGVVKRRVRILPGVPTIGIQFDCSTGD